MLDILITIILAAFLAELLGYITHILLHSNKISFLSRNHMIHHLVLYGPKKRMRSEDYFSPVTKRFNLFGIGLEWLLPAGFIFSVYGISLWFISPPLHLSVIFIAVNLVWVWVFYTYMHRAMHLQNFWMLKSKLFGKWFNGVRSLHDIHHVHLADDGRMNRNYGICFFAFDKIFRTFMRKPEPFNHSGYTAAEKRYEFIFKKLHTNNGK